MIKCGLYIVTVTTRPVGGYAYEEEDERFIFDDLQEAINFKDTASEKFGKEFRKVSSVIPANRMF